MSVPDVPKELRQHLTGTFAAQQAFSYNRDRWKHWLGHLEGLGEALEEMPDALDRPTVTSLVKAESDDNPVKAFVATMIWGHGAVGYGPYRVARLLTQSETPRSADLDGRVVGQLRKSVEIARGEGAVEAYRYLNNKDGAIRGLGPAFFTKWIHFVTAAHSEGQRYAAPILDQLVLDRLRGWGVHIRPGRTPEYEKYVEYLTAWGSENDLGLGPAEVEERIFRLIRDDGAEDVLRVQGLPAQVRESLEALARVEGAELNDVVIRALSDFVMENESAELGDAVE